MLSFEEGLRQAFKLAEGYNRTSKRDDHEPRHISEVRTTRSDGTVWTGPQSYKISFFLTPWDFLAWNQAKANSKWSHHRSLAGFIIGTMNKHTAQAMESPRKRETKNGKVIPIRKKRTAKAPPGREPGQAVALGRRK